MADLQKRVLVVDDDLSQRTAIAGMIDRWGYATDIAADGAEALEKLTTFEADAIVTDLLMPGMDGIQLLKHLRDEHGDRVPSVIVLTGYGNVETAVKTVHEYGAFWFVEKPVRPRAFRALLERAVAHRRLSRYSESLERELSNRGVLGKLCGRTQCMQEVFAVIAQAAPTKVNVLIIGESGTGKELAARAIHDLSPRRTGPFIAVNCASFPESLIESELFGHEKGAFTGAIARRPGCFELADQGTLFLDEIGEMPPALQAKLLRVLENRRVRRLGGAHEHEFDVRVVAATNRRLDELVRTGQFREDLYFRLSVVQVALPPLRDRLEDIPQLCEYILRDLNISHEARITGIDDEAYRALEHHHWKGNVRELRNVLERAVVLAREGDIQLEHLPAGFGAVRSANTQRSLSPMPSVTLSVGTTLEEAEHELIGITLTWTRHNRSRAAEILGIDPKTLYNKLKGSGAAGGE
jgi:DNA-binding NtrC family response regulator